MTHICCHLDFKSYLNTRCAVSHELTPSVKPGAFEQTQKRRMEGLSSLGPQFLSLLFLVRKLRPCQYASPNQGVQRNTWSAEASQNPRVPPAPFQINTRVRLGRRDPPSAQTENTENKCRSPKQINPCAIQSSLASREHVGDGSTGRENTIHPREG